MNRFLPFFAFCILACYGQYCQPGPTTTVDGNLGLVNMTGDDKGFVNTNDCPGYIGAQDLTYLFADIHPGGIYTLAYNVTTCGNQFPTVSGAWIDFDQNGSFDPTESLFPFNRSFGLITQTFTVKPDSPILSGMTRMRVQVQETSSTNPIDPCARFPYGGTKDFNISISIRCTSGPTTTDDGNLGPVNLKGDSSTIDDKQNCPGQIGPIDDTSQIADLTPGNSYNLSYVVTTCGGTYRSLTSAWIDYNGNTKLEDWERIIPYSSTTGTNVVQFRAAVSGPNQTVITGKVWMRVQMQETTADEINPCTEFPYGGTKDFSIQLKSVYCYAGPTALGSIQLGPVSLVGATKAISDNTACPGGTGPQNFLNQTADLIQGQSWLLQYTIVNCGTPVTFASAAWIDFDQNNIFDTWEQITPTSYATDNSFQFKVPPSNPTEQVKPGPTRLRVQVQGVATPPLNPCNVFQYGGTKDFTANIVTVGSTSHQTTSTVKIVDA